METIPSSPTVDALLANLGWVRGLAYSLVHDEAEADDLAQEAAMIALGRSREHDTPSRSWFATILRNLVRQRFQGDSRRRHREQVGAREEAVPSTRELHERIEHQRALATAIAELPEPYQSTIVLRYLESNTAVEIARIQGLPPATVRSRLMRALAMLRSKLDQAHGGDRSTWLPAFVVLARSPFPGSVEVALSSATVSGGQGGSLAGARQLADASLISKNIVLIVIVAMSVVGLTWQFGIYRGETGAPGRPRVGPSIPGDPTDQTVAVAPTVPESDRVALNATLVDPPRLDVAVVDEQGRPMPGVELFALDETQLIGRVTTDSEGRVSFSGSAGAGTLAARALDRPVGVLALDEMRGEHWLGLPAGRRVAGRLLVDGEPPETPLTLILLPKEELLDRIPASARELLLKLGVVGVERHVVVDELGRFAFEGLVEEWRGELRLPPTRWFVEAPPDASVREGGSESLLLRKPLEGLALRATRLPSLRGRIVWADTREGVDDAMVWIRHPIEWVGERKANTTSARAEVDERGRFELVLAKGNRNGGSIRRRDLSARDSGST